MDSFEHETVAKHHNPGANGGCLSDGTISITFLTCTVNAPRGADKAKEWTGLHHVGFWADDVSSTRDD
jgi:methylmalonyl-CoA/ethylmalonyl-CoA epimerase